MSYHPSIPNNEDYWEICENDEHNKEFISHIGEIFLDWPSLDDSHKNVKEQSISITKD